MQRRILSIAASLLMASSLSWGQACVEAGAHDRPLDQIALGGRLYDNWWSTCGLPEPTGNHPAYPAAGKQTGAATWRCKECHGWDYAGKDGAYAEGSHFTGIPGVAGAAGRDPAKLLSVMTDDTHRFGSLIPQATLKALALFLSHGQPAGDTVIDAGTKKVAGESRAGASIFARECADCHGERGRRLNFNHGAGEPEFVGTIAVDNPWELRHKIRNGQPGSVMDAEHLEHQDPDSSRRGMHGGMHRHMLQGQAMPAFRKRLSMAQQLDLMSYLQTLPVR